LYILLILNIFSVHAQYYENTFKKVFIEIDGEQVFDVTVITQDYQGYIWMATNLGLIRYNGVEGKK
jgi:ligand-binding sensor domain-containing protein